jgi:hypothetical protein
VLYALHFWLLSLGLPYLFRICDLTLLIFLKLGNFITHSLLQKLVQCNRVSQKCIELFDNLLMMVKKMWYSMRSMIFHLISGHSLT